MKSILIWKVILALFLTTILSTSVFFLFETIYPLKPKADTLAQIEPLTDPGYVLHLDQLVTSAALPDVVFANVEDLRGRPIYSLNGGQTWQTFPTTPWPGDTFVYNPLKIAMAPRSKAAASPIRFLVAKDRTIYRTGNYGQTWAQFTLPRADICDEDAIADFVASPANPNQLYLTQICIHWAEVTNYTVRLSKDGGINWTTLKNQARSPVPSPSLANRVYVQEAFTSNNWLQSDDGGHTWSLKNFPVDTLVLDAKDPNRLYGLAGNEGKRSVDGGARWATWASQPLCTHPEVPNKLFAHPIKTGILFVECDLGAASHNSGFIYRSLDGGNAWEKLPARTPGLLALDYGNPGGLLLSKIDGLWGSTDEGSTWTHLTFDYLSRQTAAWRKRPKPSSLATQSVFFDSLDSVAILSATDAWAGGIYDGTILHWDGNIWTPIENPTNIDNIYDITMVSRNDVWAVGACCGDMDITNGGILHWDGFTWTKSYSSPVPLYTVAMVSAKDGWAMGGYNLSGSIFRWNGSEWSQFTSSIIPTINDIAMVSTDDGWAVGGEAMIHWDGSTWTLFNRPSLYLNSIDMVSANDGWAVGDEGTILHWDGKQWAQFASPTTAYLTAVEMISASEGWAIGIILDPFGSDDSVILHWNGSKWTLLPSPTNRRLLDIAMTSSESGWIVGNYGVTLEKVFDFYLPIISKR